MIRVECEQHVMSYGHLVEGEVFVSCAGALPYKNVIHTRVPIWNKDEAGIKEGRLYDVVYNVLKSASQKKLQSIAMTTLGTGSSRFPMKVAASQIIETVKEYLQQERRTSVKEVILVAKEMGAVGALEDALKKHYGPEAVVRPGEEHREQMAAAGKSDVHGTC